MAEKKPEFTVTDRRLFTPEGELRPDTSEEQTPPPSQPATEAKAPEPPKTAEAAPQTPPPPSAADQKAQAEAYSKSTSELDARLKRELGSTQAQDLQITFERFLASLYMTALLQLGLVHEQGGRPQVDLIGARQTIDTIEILKEKTKGNLTSAEEAFLQNVLYELHMAYIEVTNALARSAQAPGPPGPKQQ
jgi:type IV secretory pathway VirB10-like protein